MNCSLCQNNEGTRRFRQNTYTILLSLILLQHCQGFKVLPRSSRNHDRFFKTAGLFAATRFDLENDNELSHLSLVNPMSGNGQNRNTYTTTALDIASLAITLGTIYTLASSYSLASYDPMEAHLESQSIEMLYEHVVYATLPEDTTDVFAIVIGESVGGLVGAACTTLVAALLRPAKTEVEQKALLLEALADSDYFMVRAVAQTLLTARGLPNVPARIASVLLAIIPYEVLKLVSKRQQQIQAEDDRIMEHLLLEQQMLNRGLFESPPVVESTEQREGMIVDVAEIFADIIKWLAYDVYRTDLGAALQLVEHDGGHSVSMGLESAVFGCLAGLSYQLYLDAVRTFTNYGPEEKLLEVRSRTFSGWVTIYGTECLAASVLFGVYETCKEPVSAFVANAVSGGMDSCLGSSNVRVCVDTYLQNNPPNPDFGEQSRNFLISFVTLWDRLWVDGSYDTEHFTHTTMLQVYTLVNQLSTYHVDISSLCNVIN